MSPTVCVAAACIAVLAICALVALLLWLTMPITDDQEGHR